MKASLFPNSAALVVIALALGSFPVGQPYPRAHADLLLYPPVQPNDGRAIGDPLRGGRTRFDKVEDTDVRS